MINERYVIEKTLGEGTFGKVAKCFDKKRSQPVALKIIKNIERCSISKLQHFYPSQFKSLNSLCFFHRYRDAAKLEINVLEKLEMKISHN